MPLPLASGRGGGASRAQRVRGAALAIFPAEAGLVAAAMEASVDAWAAPEAGLAVLLFGRRCAWCVHGGLGAIGLD